jgi:hypothetical protein
VPRHLAATAVRTRLALTGVTLAVTGHGGSWLTLRIKSCGRGWPRDASEPPDYRACFLHRDFHPGNVLFTGDGLRISGVVDWVETS